MYTCLKLSFTRLSLHLTGIFFGVCMATPSSTLASGNTVGKVYHPYVMPQETEIEMRSTFQFDEKDQLNKQQKHQLGIGASFIENLFTEVYLIGKNTNDDNFDLDAIELEAKLQLTEQGEFDEDWGLLFEYEKGFGSSLNEFSTGLLIDKEMGRWIGALNLFIGYEWAEDFKNELETSLASQLRYRYSRSFEPAVEFFQSQDTTALGPTIMGDIRFGQARKLHWETGIIFGLRSKTPDQTLRLLLEYEF